MTQDLSRRDLLKTVGAVGAGALARPGTAAEAAAIQAPAAALPVGEISELLSTSEVFIPPKGRSFMKFSFDFPEPAVSFGGHRFSFLVFTEENTYSLDRAGMKATGGAEALTLEANGFIWAGGQQKAPGKLTAAFKRTGSTIEWGVTVEMDRAIKTVTTVIRDVPKGPISLGGGALNDPKDNDVLGGYTFGAGDLHGAGTPTSMNTPVAVVQASESDFVYFSTDDDHVRPKRYYFQNGEKAFRVEAIYEHDAWREDNRITVPRWRLGHAATLEAAVQRHMAQVEKAFHLPTWEARTDVPRWMRETIMVTTLHGMHYTGYIFNDYAQQLEILRWMSTKIPAERVLVFLASWDGRYYWDYPNYEVPARMGGDPGFMRLIKEAQKLGFRMMPMFGTNSANRKQPAWDRIKAGASRCFTPSCRSAPPSLSFPCSASMAGATRRRNTRRRKCSRSCSRASIVRHRSHTRSGSTISTTRITRATAKSCRCRSRSGWRCAWATRARRSTSSGGMSRSRRSTATSLPAGAAPT